MNAAKTLRAPMDWVDRWFMAPETAAAGRMGLFRSLYGLFYLWHISIFDVSIVSGMPEDYRTSPILMFDQLSVAPSATQLRALDSLLVAALVLLVFGLCTRAVTAAVLVLGLFREALLTGVDVENSNVFLVFYLPLFMLMAGRWGDTHSLDAMLGRRGRGKAVDPSDDSWPHFLAARATLVILVVLFTTSPLFKTLLGGTWLTQPDLLSNLMLKKSLDSVKIGLTPNPVAPWIANHPPAGYVLQLSILAFEGLFFLALFGRNLRNFFVSTAIVFHAMNAFFMAVTFTPILIVYGLFVDWEGFLRRVHPRLPSFARVTSTAWIATALLAATLLAITWRAGSHAVFDLGGLLDWRSMWVPIFPLAAAWSAVSAARIIRAIGSSFGSRSHRPTAE